ncbi:hypothetical protein [Actinophytocola oryzae]|uniref:Uncharacterized protein n=1 Tax=Actinophytocola oryzae TaxID=502181 RepID=A0A4R7UQ72_9PSEU|nr:hypothetical protein [Actinophytocola oryzae]TDV35926.1 hypothetical protein CLV71_13322 [Actinophytocola oryzae]
MNGENRWHFVPRTAGSCWLSLLAGVLCLGYAVWQMADAGEAAILPVIAAVASVMLIAVAVAGLVRPGVRGR